MQVFASILSWCSKTQRFLQPVFSRMALQDKLQVDCTVEDVLFGTYLATFWACDDYTEQAGVTWCNFLTPCLTMSEKENHFKLLRKSCYMLQWSQNNPCNRCRK